MRKCTHCYSDTDRCLNMSPGCEDRCKSCGVGDRKPCTPSCVAEHDRRMKGKTKLHALLTLDGRSWCGDRYEYPTACGSPPEQFKAAWDSKDPRFECCDECHRRLIADDPPSLTKKPTLGTVTQGALDQMRERVRPVPSSTVHAIVNNKIVCGGVLSTYSLGKDLPGFQELLGGPQRHDLVPCLDCCLELAVTPTRQVPPPRKQNLHFLVDDQGGARCGINVVTEEASGVNLASMCPDCLSGLHVSKVTSSDMYRTTSEIAAALDPPLSQAELDAAERERVGDYDDAHEMSHDLAKENIRLQQALTKIATHIVFLNRIYAGYPVDHGCCVSISMDILKLSHEHAWKLFEKTGNWNEVDKKMFKPLGPDHTDEERLDVALADAVRASVAALNRPGLTMAQKLRYMRTNKGHGYAEDLFDAILSRLEVEEKQTP